MEMCGFMTLSIIPLGAHSQEASGPGNRLNVVSSSTQPAFSFGEAVVLPRPFANASPAFERPYDISRDGQRFLSVIDATQATQSAGPQAPRIQVVLNWFEELKAKVPAK